MLRILEAMKYYTILRTSHGRGAGAKYTNLGVIRASNKIEAIKKMIRRKKPRKDYAYIALIDSDYKFVAV